MSYILNERPGWQPGVPEIAARLKLELGCCLVRWNCLLPSFSFMFPCGVVVFFGFVDLRTGSIWPSILAHLTFNAIGQAFTLAPESEAGTLITLGVVLLAGIAAPILDRKGISGLFRPVPRVQAVPALPMVPGVYEFDPWEE